ncbi:hypothetical protein FOZ61_004950 [Perkinsus olseni]|uniref:Uncharacterized protein n=1 Tax=Perkinsus olseni TaxID=32597 RepID=A0A7J6MC60_PEROL|nr:hypothetical protein FOZ61_004950 [Perkinsus olseni]
MPSRKQAATTAAHRGPRATRRQNSDDITRSGSDNTGGTAVTAGQKSRLMSPIMGAVLLSASVGPMAAFNFLGFGLPFLVVASAMWTAAVYFLSVKFITPVVEGKVSSSEARSSEMENRVEELEAETKGLRGELAEARHAAEVARCEAANAEVALSKVDDVRPEYEKLEVVHAGVMEELERVRAEGEALRGEMLVLKEREAVRLAKAEEEQENDENVNSVNLVAGSGIEEEELARLREAVEVEKARRVEADSRAAEAERARRMGEEIADRAREDHESDMEAMALEGERLKAKLDHYRCLNTELEEAIERVREEKVGVEEEMAALRGAVEENGGPAGVVERLKEVEEREVAMKAELDGVQKTAVETENSLLVEVELIRSVAEEAEREVKRLESRGEELKKRNGELEEELARLQAEVEAFEVPEGILGDLGIAGKVTPEAFYDVLETKVGEWRCVEATVLQREQELEGKERELEEMALEANREKREVIRLKSILAEVGKEKEIELEELRDQVEALAAVQERFEELKAERDEAEVGAWREVTRIKGEMESLEKECGRAREEEGALKAALKAAEEELSKAEGREAELMREVEGMRKYRVQRELLESELARLRDRLEAEVDRADSAVEDVARLGEKEEREREEMEELKELAERLQGDLEIARDALNRGEVMMRESIESLKAATEEKMIAEGVCEGLKIELEKERAGLAEGMACLRDKLGEEVARRREAEKRAEEAEAKEGELMKELDGLRARREELERLREEKEKLEDVVAEKEARFSGELVMIKVELRELKAVVEAKERELADDRQTITELEDQRCQLRGDLGDAKAACQKAVAGEARLAAKVEELEEEKQVKGEGLKEECEELREKLECTRKAAVEAREEVVRDLEEAERKVQEEMKRAEELDEKCQGLVAERSKIIASLKAAEEAKEEKDEVIADLRRSAEELEKRLTSADSEIALLKAEVERSALREKELGSSVEELQMKLGRAEALTERLKEESTARDKREAKAREELRMAESRCDELQGKLDCSSTELEEASEALAATRRQLMSKENELVREAWQRQMYEKEIEGLKEAVGGMEEEMRVEKERTEEVKARLSQVERDREAARAELVEATEKRVMVEGLLEKIKVELERTTLELTECKEELREAKSEITVKMEEIDRHSRDEAELRKTHEETEEAVKRLKELAKSVEGEREMEKQARLNAEEMASELTDDKIRLESELSFIRMEQQRLEDRMAEYKAQVEEVEKRSVEKDNLITDLKHELTTTSTTGRETVTALETTRSELMATTAMLGATRRALTVARKENDELRGTTKSGG